jgi:hypothetical protein
VSLNYFISFFFQLCSVFQSFCAHSRSLFAPARSHSPHSLSARSPFPLCSHSPLTHPGPAHRQCEGPPTVESELWKRCFWALVSHDRLISMALGRSCTTQHEECVFVSLLLLRLTFPFHYSKLILSTDCLFGPVIDTFIYSRHTTT